MKITVTLIDKLTRLSQGELLPAGSLKGEWFEQMRADGILVAVTHGSRRSLRACDGQSLRNYVASHYDLPDLEAARVLFSHEDVSRAEQVQAVGDSKLRQRRTFRGFLVNCFDPIPACLNGVSVEFLPPEGSFVYIYDFTTFTIPKDVVVVGVENAENFRYLHRQRSLFGTVLQPGVKALFVSRYPQEQSRDLMEWLRTIPNRYIHFGDLDLAGVHIYQSEYLCHLGDRASFLIPDDFEVRIANGSRERYEAQYARFGKMTISDPRLQSLVDCIHRHHRGYDQEGFIQWDEQKVL